MKDFIQYFTYGVVGTTCILGLIQLEHIVKLLKILAAH
jgi:hypothetical protein